MTNNEAIEILKPLFDQCKGANGCMGYIEHYFSKDEEKALDLAIAALEERPQGECKTCKHYKPYRNTWGEPRGDGYCSIKRMTQDGELEINVNDDFYCKYYEKGGAE